MSVLARVRESRSASWLVAAAAYLLAIAGAIYLRKTSGGSSEADIAGALLMSAAMIITAFVMRSPVIPRWSLLAAAGILSAGMIAPVVIAPAASAGSDSLIGTWGYGWMYLVLLGGTRSAGPRWCHSPWVVVTVSAVLSVIGVIAQTIK